MLYRGDLPAAIELLEEARTRFRALREPLGEFDTLVLLAAATFFLEDPRDGDFSQQALALAEQHGAHVVEGLCAVVRRRRELAGRASSTGRSRTCGSACGCSNRCTT